MAHPSDIQKQIGREYVAANEDEISAGMVNELEAQLDTLYMGKKMLRQIHTKMHGLVKAAFIVEEKLPEELAVGVFIPGKKYNAWVRFSNANTKPQADKKKDVRGAAIKLMGVPGPKILNDEALQESQDFLLMNSEIFFSRNVQEFSKLLAAATSPKKIKLLLFALNPGHWRLIRAAKKANKACPHPTAISYWSTQPYQYGSLDKAVKYHLRPHADNMVIIENQTDYNYLRYNLAQTLNDYAIKFDFYVQFQTDAEAMPIEDPTVPWGSQFIKLATLIIPPQIFDSKEQIEFGDNMSFNPWHSLPAHRPLGGFNRVRKRIYETLSKYRHTINGIPLTEPKDSDDFLGGNIPETTIIPTAVPLRNMIRSSAAVLVNCNKETAFDYISSSEKLPTWLKKVGLISACERVEILIGPYNKVGAKRKVIFDNGDYLQEELISFHPFANYSYRVTAFSDFLKHFTPAANGQLWFDTVENRTRINWVYSYSYKNVFGRMILWLFNKMVFKKYMKKSLQHAKAHIENSYR